MAKNILKFIVTFILGGIGGSLLAFHYTNSSTSIQTKCENSASQSNGNNNNTFNPNIHIENKPDTPVEHKNNEPSNKTENPPQKQDEKQDAKNEISKLQQEFISYLQSTESKSECDKLNMIPRGKSILDTIENIAIRNGMYFEYKYYIQSQRQTIHPLTIADCSNN